MSASNQHRADTFVVERLVRPDRSGEPVPLVGSGVEQVLRPLVTSAARDPQNWHSISGYGVAIRVLPSSGVSRGTSFEIRTSSALGSIHRYRYEADADTLSCWDYEEVVHPNLNAQRELPNDPEELAFLVAALFRAKPESIEASSVPGQEFSAESRVGSEGRAYGPLTYAFADIVRHVTVNWFGGRETTWGRPLRLLYAFLGSVTFFAMQSVIILRDERFVPYFTVQTEGRDPATSAQGLFLTVEELLVLIVFLCGMFAVISGYIDRQHGPVRLYLGGFLLPYFTWSLIVLINS